MLKKNILIISFSFLIILNQLNYFRFKIENYVLFFPRFLSLLFLIIFFIKIIDLLIKKFNLDLKNFIFLFLFFLQVFLSLIFVNDDFSNGGFKLKLLLSFIYEIIKYFFIYFFFCIIGLNLINNKNILLIFKIISSLTIIILLFGFFVLINFHFTFFDLVQRVFYYDSASAVGYRFFSVLGEPRDAAAFLITNFFILLVIYLNFDKKIKQDLFYYFFIISFLSIIAFFLTKSFSGILGLFFGSVISILFYLEHLIIRKNVNFKSIIKLLLILFIFVFIFFIFSKFDRIFEYINQIYKFLLNNQNVDDRVKSQFKDILPVAIYIESIWSLNIKEIFFGYGSYSSYYLNNFEYAHPHSFFSRLIYDNGLIGLTLFLLFIYSCSSKQSKLVEKISLSFCLGMFLAVNSTFLFTFIMFMLHIKNINSKNQKNYENK